MRRWLLAAALVLAGTATAAAQSFGLDGLLPQGSSSVSGRIVQIVALLSIMSVAPGLLMMVTSFSRIVIALSFLRSGLGLQTTPANLILISLALFMTFFVMAPTFDRAWQDGVMPLVENRIGEAEAYQKITAPFRDFMLAQTRPADLKLFADIAPPSIRPTDQAQSVDLRILIPSFMISELRRAFEIGFLIALPFLVIDMIVATIVMSMGMMMLPPTVISLPFKVIFFVLIDGWNLLIGGLVRSFA
ncbi:MAG: flagellar biosynthetic protein FliP [Chelatococcus sp.]|nr:MAG: flagellar biosynthetic protein FliP [Chelatococcus sp.]